MPFGNWPRWTFLIDPPTGVREEHSPIHKTVNERFGLAYKWPIFGNQGLFAVHAT